MTDAKRIIEQNLWPREFLSLEGVIKLGPDNKQVACFLNPDDLTDTVKELIEARSEITVAEVAYLLNLSDRVAAKQMLRASKMSWAQLRPFA